jgi:hypothetical protein
VTRVDDADQNKCDREIDRTGADRSGAACRAQIVGGCVVSVVKVKWKIAGPKSVRDPRLVLVAPLSPTASGLLYWANDIRVRSRHKNHSDTVGDRLNRERYWMVVVEWESGAGSKRQRAKNIHPISSSASFQSSYQHDYNYTHRW